MGSAPSPPAFGCGPCSLLAQFPAPLSGIVLARKDRKGTRGRKTAAAPPEGHRGRTAAWRGENYAASRRSASIAFVVTSSTLPSAEIVMTSPCAR